MVLIPLLFLGISSTLEKQFLLLSFALIVENKYYGISYGFHGSSLNFGASLGPLLFGYIRDLTINDSNGNLCSFLVIISFEILKMILIITIYIYDRKNGNKLLCNTQEE